LIDVVFLLLIFFMVSTTFKDDVRIEVQLPEAQGEEVPSEEIEAITIVIDSAGNYYVNDRQVVDERLDTLKKAIAGVAGGDPELPVILKADARTPHQSVMTAMDAASQLGLVRFSFSASRPSAKQ
jgi:biopolymer transport protein ExbD